MCQIWKLVVVLPTVYVCVSSELPLSCTHTNTVNIKVKMAVLCPPVPGTLFMLLKVTLSLR